MKNQNLLLLAAMCALLPVRPSIARAADDGSGASTGAAQEVADGVLADSIEHALEDLGMEPSESIADVVSAIHTRKQPFARRLRNEKFDDAIVEACAENDLGDVDAPISQLIAVLRGEDPSDIADDAEEDNNGKPSAPKKVAAKDEGDAE